jgi:hypothetical protein
MVFSMTPLLAINMPVEWGFTILALVLVGGPVLAALIVAYQIGYARGKNSALRGHGRRGFDVVVSNQDNRPNSPTPGE